MSKCVAILDDSPIVIDATRQMLEPLGWRVIGLEKAMTAPMTIMREQPAIVLVDMDMPMITGDNFIKFAKSKMKSVDNTLFVLYSGKDAKELRGFARSSGADGYICKTQSATDLDLALQRLLP